jgi:hypothetical protein
MTSCPWIGPLADELSSVHQIGLAVSDGDITRFRRYVGG